MSESNILPWEAMDNIIERSWVKIDDEGISLSGPHPLSVEDRVKEDAVREYWVQQYVSSNPDRLGLSELEGPFETGPDFRAKVKGIKGKVDVEVEVRCVNYIKHG